MVSALTVTCPSQLILTHSTQSSLQAKSIRTVDLELAKNAKIKSIIFTYGYGNYDKIIQGKPDYILDEFIKLYEVL